MTNQSKWPVDSWTLVYLAYGSILGYYNINFTYSMLSSTIWKLVIEPMEVVQLIEKKLCVPTLKERAGYYSNVGDLISMLPGYAIGNLYRTKIK